MDISAGSLDATKNVQPVRFLDTDDPSKAPRPGIGLCLSGGGYRAMLFHLGTIWRLNELGILKKLDRVSSVSGGSITAGVLGFAWNKLTFDTNGIANNFGDLVLTPIRELAGDTIDAGSIIKGLLLPR